MGYNDLKRSYEINGVGYEEAEGVKLAEDQGIINFSLQTSIYSKQEVTFESDGETIAAWLYMPPASTQAVPCVVMANGISLTRNDGILAHAESFAKAGFAALVFDYTSFGDSTGTPRNNLSVKGQRQDYRAAIRFARNFPAIHPGAIIIWGYSFASGHVLHIAREDPTIAAVICVAPYLNDSSSVSTHSKIGIAKAVVREGWSHVRNPRAAHLNPVMFPVVGPPGSAAIITTEEGIPGFEQVTPEDSRWINQVTVRGLMHVTLDKPRHDAPFLKMPVLFCVGSYDQTALPHTAIKTIQHTPRGKYKLYTRGHFDIHSDAQVHADEVKFATRHLRHYLFTVV